MDSKSVEKKLLEKKLASLSSKISQLKESIVDYQQFKEQDYVFPKLLYSKRCDSTERKSTGLSYIQKLNEEIKFSQCVVKQTTATIYNSNKLFPDKKQNREDNEFPKLLYSKKCNNSDGISTGLSYIKKLNEEIKCSQSILKRETAKIDSSKELVADRTNEKGDYVFPKLLYSKRIARIEVKSSNYDIDTSYQSNDNHELLSWRAQSDYKSETRNNTTADVTPQVTSDVTPQVTSDVTPQVTSDVTLQVTADVTPQVTADVTPQVIEISSDDDDEQDEFNVTLQPIKAFTDDRFEVTLQPTDHHSYVSKFKYIKGCDHVAMKKIKDKEYRLQTQISYKKTEKLRKAAIIEKYNYTRKGFVPTKFKKIKKLKKKVKAALALALAEPLDILSRCENVSTDKALNGCEGVTSQKTFMQRRCEIVKRTSKEKICSTNPKVGNRKNAVNHLGNSISNADMLCTVPSTRRLKRKKLKSNLRNHYKQLLPSHRNIGSCIPALGQRFDHSVYKYPTPLMAVNTECRMVGSCIPAMGQRFDHSVYKYPKPPLMTVNNASITPTFHRPPISVPRIRQPLVVPQIYKPLKVRNQHFVGQTNPGMMSHQRGVNLQQLKPVYTETPHISMLGNLMLSKHQMLNALATVNQDQHIVPRIQQLINMVLPKAMVELQMLNSSSSINQNSNPKINQCFVDSPPCTERPPCTEHPNTPEGSKKLTLDTLIPETNVGHRMLRSMGWNPGQGLGKRKSGIIDPVRAEKRHGPRRLGFGGAPSKKLKHN